MLFACIWNLHQLMSAPKRRKSRIWLRHYGNKCYQSCMKKIVFMNPWLLFILYWVVAVFAIVLQIVSENHIATFGGMLLGYFASFVLIWSSLFWLHAAYKYLSGLPINSQLWNSKFFDWPMVFIVTLIPVGMISSAYVDGVEFSKPIYSLINTIEAVIVLVVFGTLFGMIWSISKMLKGGFWWCVTLFYWPLFAVFVQNEIRELYHETDKLSL